MRAGRRAAQLAESLAQTLADNLREAASDLPYYEAVAPQAE
jgi:hypothetical protein